MARAGARRSLSRAGWAASRATGDTMVIVDTTVWVDYLNGASTPEVEWLDRETSRQRLGLLDVMACDCLIASFCIEQNHALLHTDRDFDPFEAFLEPAGGASMTAGRPGSRGNLGMEAVGCYPVVIS